MPVNSGMMVDQIGANGNAYVRSFLNVQKHLSMLD